MGKKAASKKRTLRKPRKSPKATARTPKGRPTKYLLEFDQRALKMCLLGYTDEQLADYFEISVATLNNWKKQYPSFLASIRAGKSEADGDVASAMFKSANGFSYDETTYERQFQEIDGLSEKEESDIKLEVWKKKVVTKFVVPDTRAGMFWLKNRQPKAWRDKIDATVTNINTAPLTKEEIKEISKALHDDL